MGSREGKTKHGGLGVNLTNEMFRDPVDCNPSA